MKAIYKRELRSFFTSMTGYIFIAVVTAYIGLYFFIYNMMIGYPTFSATLGSAASIFIFVTPVITMRTMAEERHTKTDQLILTSPTTVTSMVLGKYFSTLTVFAMPLLISCLCPIIISMYGSGYMLGDYSMIFAVLCFGALLVAIGIFISSLTESQVIAAVLTLIVDIILYLWNMVTYYVPSEPFGVLIGFVILWLVACMICYSISKNLNLALIMAVLGVGVMGVLYLYNADMFEGKLASFLSILSITAPLDNFSDYSVFDVGGIFFYISFSALLLFLTVQTVQKRRLG